MFMFMFLFCISLFFSQSHCLLGLVQAEVFSQQLSKDSWIRGRRGGAIGVGVKPV